MKRFNLFFYFFILSIHWVFPVSGELTYAQKSATGELLTITPTPIAKLDFTYNTNVFFAETTITGTSSISYANGMAILQTFGSGSATLSSRIHSYAQPGQGFSCLFAAMYLNGDSGTSQMAGVGNDIDGLFFGLVNGVFSIVYKNNSVTIVIPQSNWNVDGMNGSGPSGITLDYTKGNIFKIQYQQLEFGNINFLIESPITGYPILVHQIQYANANTIPSLSNSGLQLMAEASSQGGIGELNISSMSLFLEGDVNPYLGIRNNVTSNSTVNTTLSNVVTIQNDLVFSSITNQVMVIPDQLSLCNPSLSGDDAIFYLYLNPIVDSPLFSNVINSVVSFDTTGNSLTGGTLVDTFFLQSDSELTVNMTVYGIQLSPGDSLVVACKSQNSPVTVYASMSWLEQF